MTDINEKERLLGLHIDEKAAQSKSIIKKAVERFGVENIAIAITGGKDSTTNLWLWKQACDEMGKKLPVCMFIDEGDVFDEINEFVGYIKSSWALDIAWLKNEDVSSKAPVIGDTIRVSTLTAANQAALQEMGFNEAGFPFIPDSTVCNHLMKTLPMREFIAQNHIKAVSTAIRWDEQTARKDEDYFSPRTNPEHTRIHSILHFRERDIWIAIFKYAIPYNKLYKLGYRSLGARCATGKASDIPAWMQDLENTQERVGRGQDKEQVMDHLRALGYM
ncbi:MAG: phosphoadenosine phosphosulfate reductase family protein [Nitrospirae bacterium]|nr:phosphoadenosine phosphosulfate reductase family protein [Nitrospirota bacterium]MBI3378219.1 phosphoadenosine phosphosulfate reductase family protein [Nitrospirota bacterium]